MVQQRRLVGTDCCLHRQLRRLRLVGVSFCNPLIGQFGNSGRNILRGPGINNLDMGLGKDFRLTERVGFQFRAEAFNVFNHTSMDSIHSPALESAHRWAIIQRSRLTAKLPRRVLGASCSLAAKSYSDLLHTHPNDPPGKSSAWRIFPFVMIQGSIRCRIS